MRVPLLCFCRVMAKGGDARMSGWHRVHRFTRRRFRLFPACTAMRQGVPPHVSSHKTPVSGVWAKVFPTFPGLFGLQQKITREHLRTTAFGQKSTRAWHHSWSLVHAQESVLGLPEERCFSWEKPQPICRMDDFSVEPERKFNTWDYKTTRNGSFRCMWLEQFIFKREEAFNSNISWFIIYAILSPRQSISVMPWKILPKEEKKLVANIHPLPLKVFKMPFQMSSAWTVFVHFPCQQLPFLSNLLSRLTFMKHCTCF